MWDEMIIMRKKKPCNFQLNNGSTLYENSVRWTRFLIWNIESCKPETPKFKSKTIEYWKLQIRNTEILCLTTIALQADFLPSKQLWCPFCHDTMITKQVRPSNYYSLDFNSTKPPKNFLHTFLSFHSNLERVASVELQTEIKNKIL